MKIRSTHKSTTAVAEVRVPPSDGFRWSSSNAWCRAKNQGRIMRLWKESLASLALRHCGHCGHCGTTLAAPSLLSLHISAFLSPFALPFCQGKRGMNLKDQVAECESQMWRDGSLQRSGQLKLRSHIWAMEWMPICGNQARCPFHVGTQLPLSSHTSWTVHMWPFWVYSRPKRERESVESSISFPLVWGLGGRDTWCLSPPKNQS
jgi:hypothetical protein